MLPRSDWRSRADLLDREPVDVDLCPFTTVRVCLLGVAAKTSHRNEDATTLPGKRL